MLDFTPGGEVPSQALYEKCLRIGDAALKSASSASPIRMLIYSA